MILGIESTAHTFGIGIVRDNNENFILADERAQYIPEKGGIHPREASRYLAEKAPYVIARAFENSGISVSSISAIAVALGPGLGPCLRVGATIARAMASYLSKPLVPVNHAVAHIEIGIKLTNARDPVIVYLSGGNTAVLAFVNKRYRVFGETLDIALGNLLDTFARETGLGPPYVVNGVHVVDRCASKGRKILLDLPYVVKGQDVAFSGLLTAALRAYKRGIELEDICLTLREIAYNSIIEIASRCLTQTKKREVMVVGGVAASPILREKLEAMAKFYGVYLKIVPPKYAVDNGVMIAWTGLLAFRTGVTIPIEKALIRQRWRVDEVEIPWRI
ncbi:MAG TPA: N(6)-L-threonylcarbamoyladenine synthase Kae1 [Ignisphaera sp.]|nr:N(6)-L-threonylcarbamoyladenine synthase Kae1 [Ignisphaera sp.]